jgi:hypothetical protein
MNYGTKLINRDEVTISIAHWDECNNYAGRRELGDM